MRTFLGILREALVRAFDAGCFSIAKGAAYSMILSFFPTLLLLADLLAGSRTTAALMREVTYALGRVLPPNTRQMALQYFTAEPEHSPRLLITAAVIALFASTGVMTSFFNGFRASYRIRQPWSFWKEEGMALALVFLAGTPMLAATALIVFGEQVQSWLIYEIGLPMFLTLLWAASRWAVAIATSTLVLAIIYYIGPNHEEGFHCVLPGALLSTMAWLAATALFGWYVQNIAQYSGIYGSLGTAVALLVWMYLMAAIVLIGAQFNAVCELRRRGV